MLSRNNTRTLLRRILDPSAKTLFAISLITFCAAVYFAIPNMQFLLKGSLERLRSVKSSLLLLNTRFTRQNYSYQVWTLSKAKLRLIVLT